MKYRDDSFGPTVLAIVIALVLVVGVWVLSSAFEAAAYRRVTGKQVSTWDAMFLDLRVQEQVQP